MKIKNEMNVKDFKSEDDVKQYIQYFYNKMGFDGSERCKYPIRISETGEVTVYDDNPWGNLSKDYSFVICEEGFTAWKSDFETNTIKTDEYMFKDIFRVIKEVQEEINCKK